MGELNFSISDVQGVLEGKLQMKPRSAGERNYWFYLDSRKCLRVTLPQGRGPLKPGTANSIINQLKLCKSQFWEYLTCKNGLRDFEYTIRGKISMGLIPFTTPPALQPRWTESPERSTRDL
jgi:hypothetical protein